MNYPGTLQALNQLSRMVAQARTLDQLLWCVTNSCTRFLQLEDFVIYLRQEKEETLIQSAAFGEKCGKENSILNPLRIPIGKGIVGITAQTRQVQKVDDTSKNDHYLVDDRIRLSELAVPIIWNDKVIGVIDSEHQHKGYFSSFYVDVFCLIAALCAPIIDQFLRKEKKKIKADNHYYQQLIQLLEEEKIYRNRQLSLDGVAGKLNITPVYLSNIINQAGGEPFATLVNKYRIREVQDLIQQGQHRHYNLLALAYQAGFNSKSSFNHNFKLQTRLTPSDFVREVDGRPKLEDGSRKTEDRR